MNEKNVLDQIKKECKLISVDNFERIKKSVELENKQEKTEVIEMKKTGFSVVMNIAAAVTAIIIPVSVMVFVTKSTSLEPDPDNIREIYVATGSETTSQSEKYSEALNHETNKIQNTYGSDAVSVPDTESTEGTEAVTSADSEASEPEKTNTMTQIITEKTTAPYTVTFEVTESSTYSGTTDETGKYTTKHSAVPDFSGRPNEFQSSGVTVLPSSPVSPETTVADMTYPVSTVPSTDSPVVTLPLMTSYVTKPCMTDRFPLESAPQTTACVTNQHVFPECTTAEAVTTVYETVPPCVIVPPSTTVPVSNKNLHIVPGYTDKLFSIQRTISSSMIYSEKIYHGEDYDYKVVMPDSYVIHVYDVIIYSYDYFDYINKGDYVLKSETKYSIEEVIEGASPLLTIEDLYNAGLKAEVLPKNQ